MDVWRSRGGQTLVTDSETAKVMGFTRSTDAEVRTWYLTTQLPYRRRMMLAADARKARAAEQAEQAEQPRKKGCGCGKAEARDEGQQAREQARSWVRMAKGAVGLAATALGAGQADETVVAARWNACARCDRNLAGVCSECGCHLSAKVRLTYERCPIDRWAAARAT